MKTFLDEPENGDVLYYKLKRMSKTTKSFDKTQPHSKRKCNYNMCAWHPKKEAKHGRD